MTTTTQTYDPEAIARAVIHHLMATAVDGVDDYDLALIEEATEPHELTLPDDDDDQTWDEDIVPAIDRLTKQVREHVGPVLPEVTP